MTEEGSVRRADGSTGPLIEIAIPVTDELVEPIFELFQRHGGGAAIETQYRDAASGHDGPETTWVRTWLPVHDEVSRTRVEQGLWHLGQIMPIPEASIRELAEANWAETWKAHYTAQRVGRFIVAPGWLDVPEADEHIPLRLDPGMAFGTGQHPTSRLCLKELSKVVQRGASVLDVGTGSGILAIGAALLGADHVVALDIDPRAAETAAENARANDVSIDARAGSLEALSAGETFDLTVANILAPVIIDLADGLARTVRDGGRLIASGILDTQADDVTAALTDAGFEPPEVHGDGDWVALVARRPSAP